MSSGFQNFALLHMLCQSGGLFFEKKKKGWERREIVQECLSSHSTSKTNLFRKLED